MPMRMRAAISVLLLIGFTLAGVRARAAAQSTPAVAALDDAAVTDAWRAYRTALVERDGKRISGLVTPESLAEYERQRKLALSLTRPQLLQADTLDRYMTLMLRARLSGAELRAMTGATLLALYIERGWVGSDLPSGIQVKRIDGARAHVAFVKDGAEVPVDVPIVRRVGTRWLVDLVELNRLSRPALLSMFSRIAEARATDVNGAMELAIGKLTGSSPSASIWDPPK